MAGDGFPGRLLVELQAPQDVRPPSPRWTASAARVRRCRDPPRYRLELRSGTRRAAPALAPFVVAQGWKAARAAAQETSLRKPTCACVSADEACIEGLRAIYEREMRSYFTSPSPTW